MEKTTAKLALTSFISQGSIVIYNLGLVYYLRSIGFSSLAIGFASAIYPFMYFLFCMVFPHVLPSLKGKARAIISVVGMGVSGLVLLLTRNIALIYFILALYGIVQALLWTNVETWITGGANGRELTKRISVFNFSWSFGAGLATAVAGYLAEGSTSRPFFFAFSTFLIASLLLLSTPGNEGKGEEEKSVEGDHSSPLRYLAWTGVVLVYTGYSLVLTVFPQYALDSLGFSESLTGNILLFRGMAVCASFIFLSQSSRWQKGKGVILLSQLLFVLATLSMLLLSSIISFAVVFILYGVIFALSYDLSIYHGAEGAADRDRRMMIHEVLLTAGTIIGAVFGGAVYQYFSFQTLVLSISALGIVSLAIEMVLSKRLK